MSDIFERIKEELDKTPDNPELYFKRGNIFYQNKNFENAILDFSKVIEFDEYHVNSYFNRGRCYQDLNMLEKSIQDYSKVIELKPNLHIVYNNRGSAYQDMEDFEKAIQDFSVAIALNPRDYISYFNRGNSYSSLGNNEKAIEDLSTSIKINPNIFGAHYNRGLAYIEIGKLELALQDFSRSIELNEDFIHAFNNRGNVFQELKQYKKSILDFSKAIKLDPTDPQSYFNRGNTFSFLEDFRKAINDFTKAIELNPEFVLAYVNRGLSFHEDLESYQKAIDDFSTAIALDPHDITTYKHRGDTYLRLDEYEKAILDFSKSIELNPEYIDGYFGRGRAYMYSREIEKAIDDFSKVIELKPSDTEALYNLGVLFLIKKRIEEAYSTFQNCLKIDPNNNNAKRLSISMELEKVNEIDVQKKLGSGVYGLAYLIEVSGIGKMVLKIFKPWSCGFDEKKMKEMLNRDTMYLAHHQNVVSILHHREKITLFTKKFPDYEEYWKDRNIEKMEDVPIIIMEYHEKSLADFLQINKEKGLDPEIICCVLRDIIDGTHHLHRRKRVHRDLHPGNVLVEDGGRKALICDFGYILNLHLNKTGFIVSKKDERLLNMASYSCSDYYYGKVNVGGYAKYLPPEIIDAAEDDTIEVIDYEKCDLYSVGKIGETMIDQCLSDGIVKRLFKKFIGRFLENYESRISFWEAKRGIKRLKKKVLEIKNTKCNSEGCLITGIENLKLCKGCRTVFYCSPNCQKLDWKKHKKNCVKKNKRST